MCNMQSFEIEPMTQEHWEAVREIYLQGIATGNATFETSVPGWKEWDQRHLTTCRLIARSATKILGWAALSPVSSRCVYAGVAEVSIYVAEEARGHGIGRRLLAALVEASEQNGIWTCTGRHFQRECSQYPTPPAGRLSHRGYPRAAWMPGRPLAGHRPDGTQEPGGGCVEAIGSVALYQGTTLSRAVSNGK